MSTGSSTPCPVCLGFCQGRHETPPVEAVDFPRIGERVIYTLGDGTGRRVAYVRSVAGHDGDVDLVASDDPDDWDKIAQDVKRGAGPHTYERIDA